MKCSPAAEFRDVTFRYSKSDAPLIENLSFQVRKGEFVALVGPSGCGKSTVFRLLNRLNEPEQGEVRINAACGYMPQQDMLFPWRTVAENAALRGLRRQDDGPRRVLASLYYNNELMSMALLRQISKVLASTCLPGRMENPDCPQ